MMRMSSEVSHLLDGSYWPVHKEHLCFHTNAINGGKTHSPKSKLLLATNVVQQYK